MNRRIAHAKGRTGRLATLEIREALHDLGQHALAQDVERGGPLSAVRAHEITRALAYEEHVHYQFVSI